MAGMDYCNPNSSKSEWRAIHLLTEFDLYANIARMNNHEPMNEALADLMDKANLKQADLAGLVGMNPSRLSRLLGGLTELTKEEAREIAAKIPTDDARDY